MRRGIPIYGKVLGWLAVNVLVLALLVLGFLRLQFHMSLDWMLVGSGGGRIEELSERLTYELARLPEEEWTKVLRQNDETYGVKFALFSRDGTQEKGAPLQVPPEVMPKLVDNKPRGAGAGGERPQVRRPAKLQPKRPANAPPKPRFMQRAGSPAKYWAGIHVDLEAGADFHPLTLVMVSDSITGGGLFFDLWPWLGLGTAGLICSALVWMPFVRGLTRSIGQLNTAAGSIARGNFNDRVSERRRDELGELSSSVNAMAKKLGHYVAEQRRITADVAHELCSPIARMQMALGIVEQRSTPDQSNYLKKLDSELQHMAKLVEEVLAFSKAESLPQRADPEDINLAELVAHVVAREGSGGTVETEIPADLHLVAIREALDRALGNVLRNAVRYAGSAGPISIRVEKSKGSVCIQVSDIGPGVPEEALPRLFEAFYRPEAARARHTGGSGLGLAIVKRCVEACHGTVEAKLRSPHGLLVEMQFTAVD